MILMKNIKYLIGSEQMDNRPFQPFSLDVCSFFADVSGLLMKTSREYPDVLSFAYWCRKSNLQHLKKMHSDCENRLGRGVAFHITPGNIPVNFAFSFAFALIAGNCCIVRVPPKPFVQTDLILEAIAFVLERYPQLKSRIAFVDYPIDNDITAHFSSEADVRVLWGGNRTINLIKSIPAKPRCVDISFADRYSICIIDGSAVLELDAQGLQRLSEQYYNDTYLMDQNACSSPQLMLWINDSKEARTCFWSAVERCAEEKYILQPELAVEKYTKLCEDAIDGVPVELSDYHNNLLIRLELQNLIGNVQSLRGKGGYFYEYHLESLDEIADFVTDSFQTLCYFGVQPTELRELVIRHRLCGIDRIVPIGKAMDIGLVWDGYDLVDAMSRIVALQ